MSTSRVLLLFLAILFLVILVLSGNRFSAGFSDRFFSVFPGTRTAQKTTGTPTPAKTASETRTTPPPAQSTPAPEPENITKGGVQGSSDERQPTPSKDTPATGPAETTVALIGGSFLLGILLRRYHLLRG